MPWNPFDQLGSVAAQIVTDAWTAAWLSVWNAGPQQAESAAFMKVLRRAP